MQITVGIAVQRWKVGEVGMVDRDKVIKGLEFIKKKNHGASCFDKECPYFDRANGGYLRCCDQLASEAIELIRQQDEAIEIAFQHGVDAGSEAQWASEHI